jgi:UPF0716 family protein affecting phage T7 exclusion
MDRIALFVLFALFVFPPPLLAVLLGVRLARHKGRDPAEALLPGVALAAVGVVVASALFFGIGALGTLVGFLLPAIAVLIEALLPRPAVRVSEPPGHGLALGRRRRPLCRCLVPHLPLSSRQAFKRQTPQLPPLHEMEKGPGGEDTPYPPTASSRAAARRKGSLETTLAAYSSIAPMSAVRAIGSPRSTMRTTTGKPDQSSSVSPSGGM